MQVRRLFVYSIDRFYCAIILTRCILTLDVRGEMCLELNGESETPSRQPHCNRSREAMLRARTSSLFSFCYIMAAVFGHVTMGAAWTREKVPRYEHLVHTRSGLASRDNVSAVIGYSELNGVDFTFLKYLNISTCKPLTAESFKFSNF